MAASFVASITLQVVGGYDAADPAGAGFAIVMLWTVGISTVVWVTVTLLTRPEPEATLATFYRRVRPGGPGWRAVATRLGFGDDRIPGGALSWVNWIAGLGAVFSTLAATGELMLGSPAKAFAEFVVAAVCFGLIARNLRSDKTFASAGVDTAAGAS